MTNVTPTLRLVVLKTEQLDRLRSFYEAMGISFTREQHGTGPVHEAAVLGDAVLELYPAGEGETSDVQVRLGFAVADLDATLRKIETVRFAVVTQPRQTPWGMRAVVRDADGRTVELTWLPHQAGSQP